MRLNNTSDVPIIRPLYGKQLIYLKAADIPTSRALPATDVYCWTALHGKNQLFTCLWFSGPLMPSCTALEDGTDDRLPSDDDNNDDEETDSGGDLAFDEYTVSESESANE